MLVPSYEGRYADLEINNGAAASFAFQAMSRVPTQTRLACGVWHG